MKHFGTVIGTSIAGMIVMSVWGPMVQQYGFMGGWLAALIIIGPMWYLNHYLGVTNNEGAWVDMALGLAVTGVAKGIFLDGIQAGIDSMPTLIWVLIGGALGGISAAMIQKYFQKKSEEEAKLEKHSA